VLATNQLPITPWPFVSPGLLSPLNVYSGQSLYVTCRPPSGRTIVFKVPGSATLLVSSDAGANNGGQVLAQDPEHTMLGPDACESRSGVK
jgi:hypothetical protein